VSVVERFVSYFNKWQNCTSSFQTSLVSTKCFQYYVCPARTDHGDDYLTNLVNYTVFSFYVVYLLHILSSCRSVMKAAEI